MRLLTYRNIKYFQSGLLRDNNFKHAFLTKRSYKNVPIELQNQLNLTSNIHYLKQIHSNKLINVYSKLNSKPKVADSLIKKEKNQSLCIYTGYCIPILIADIERRNIAAFHPGFNGLKKQIISKTLKSLEGIGSKENNLIIALGPSIKGDKYQIKKKDAEELIYQISGKAYLEKSFCRIEIN